MRPKVFSYLDYRDFLFDMFQYAKENEKLTLRLFARRANLGAHSFLKQIIDGEKSLTIDSSQKIARGFKLNEQESEFLELLVRFDNAIDLEEKNLIYEKINKQKPHQKLSKIDEKHFFLFSNWYVMAIREMVALPEFREDYAYISRTLYPNISIKQAKEALQILLDLGYLIRDNDNKLRQKVPELTTGPEITSNAIMNYHQNMLETARYSLQNTPARWRDVSSLSFIINKNEFDFIKKKTVQFRKEIIEYLNDRKNGSFPEDHFDEEKVLYNLNIQLYNASKLKWKDKIKNAV